MGKNRDRQDVTTDIPEGQRFNYLCATKDCGGKVFQIIDAGELWGDKLNPDATPQLAQGQGLICVKCCEMLDPGIKQTPPQEIFEKPKNEDIVG